MQVEIRRHHPGASEGAWTYAQLDARQREIAARVREGGDGALLLSELAPVITVGRRTAPGDLTLPEPMLAARGVQLVRVDRGGFATWHGPGQWVLFVVDRLERLTGDPRGVRAAVCGLVEIALRVGRARGLEVEAGEGARLGAWTRRGKFAAVGVHIEQGVLLHGVAINGLRTPLSFQGLRPCGLEDPVDFLLPDGSEPAEFEALSPVILESARAVFPG